MSTSIERCHYITRVKSKQNSIQNLFETVKSIESRVQNGLYEFPWLFKVRSSVIYMEDSDPEERLRDAFCSMIREQDKMVPNHFIENYHSCVINDKMIGDPYHPDLAEFKYFKEKPLNFLVIGKPGLNTETVAYRLADIWKSILISPAIAVQTVLPYTLDNKSKTKSKEGTHQLTLEQILEAVNFMQTSAESKRQGYVLTGFPLTSFSTNTFDIEKQLEFIFKNITRPNIIIYLTCPSNDVIRLNENGYFRNIHNNNLYYKQHIEDGEAVYLKTLVTQSVSEFENNRYLLKEYYNFKEEEKTKFFVLESNKNLNNAILDNYMGKIFPILDRYLLQYDSQCVFKVDGRHTTVEIIETIQDKLNILCLIPLCDPSPVFGVADDAGVATKPDSLSFNSILSFEEIKFDVLRKTIESPEESEEETSKDDDESVENDLENKKSSTNEIDLLVLDRYKNLGKQEAFELLKKHCSPNKRFNLLVSDYNNLCPVEMHRGYICEGEIKYTCKYAGKLFLLSSLDAVRKFLKDPARYALSPPLSTRKIAVIGPPMTGKSTVAYYLSGFFGIKVISIRRLIEKVYGLTMRKIEGNMFEVFVEKVRRLQRREGEKHRESEELRASKITNWIKEQIPIIIERLKYSSFTSNQITPTTNEENMAEISMQPLILPNLSFDEFIDTLKKEIKSMTSFEVNFGGKFSQLYKNPQPDFKETYSLTEADSSMMRLRDDFSSRGFDFFDDVIKCKEFLTDPLKLAVYLPPNLRLPEQVREMSYEDVLKSVIDYNGIHTPFGFLRMDVKKLADALEEEILDIEAENNLDYKLESDLKMGGWILDSLPIDEGLWSEVMTRFLLPDDLICKIVDVDCLDAVKDHFLKVEPFTKLKDCYEELVKSSRSIRNFEIDNNICSKNRSFDEQCTTTKNVSSDETSENEKLGKFLFPDSSVTSFTTKSTRCNNPFNNEDHEISYLRANFWCDRSFLTDYFEQSVTKYLQTAKAEKVSVIGNLHRIQNKDSIESLRLSFAEPIQHSKTTLSSPLDSSLIIEDLSNIDNLRNSINSNSNHKNNLHSQIGLNKHLNRTSTGIEGLRNIQGDISKLHETQLENIKSEDYIHWFNERELSLTNEMIWTLEEQHCSKSNSDLSSSILSQVQQNESGDRSPEKEASMKSIYSNSCLQFIREGNNYIFNDMSMSLFALHSLVMSELNIFKNKLDTWLVEPFDVTSEFLTKFKTLYPEQFINETNVPLLQCRSKSELQFYQRIVTEKFNLINAIEALMKQDDQFDQVVDYLSNYTQHNGDNLSTEKCFSTTRCSMIPKRQKGTTSLPNVRDSKHQDRFLHGSKLSDSISYDELSVSSDSLTVFEWYVVSDDVLLFSRQSSDFKMIDTEKPSEIYVKRTSKDMELPNMPLKQTASQSLKKDLSSSKSFSMQDARWERPCIWRDCVETKVCHKQTKQRESVNTICKNVVKEIVSSVSSRKRDGKGESNSSKNYSKYDKTGENTSYQTRNLSENSDEASTTKNAVETNKFDHLGPEQDSKCDEIVKEETSPQPSSPMEISNDKKLTSEEAVKTLESADLFVKVGKDIETCSQTLTLSNKSKASSNLIQSDQESRSENSKNSSTKTVSINGDSRSECSYSKAACSKYKCSNTERPYMKLTPFENSKTECLLPHVSADNWLKFLNFISDVYSNIGQFEGRSFEDSVEEVCDKVSKSDMYCGVGMKDDENLDGVGLQRSDCVENKMCHKQTEKCESDNTICKNLVKEIVSSILSRKRDGKDESISSKNHDKTGEKTFYQTWQGYDGGGKKIILKDDSSSSGDYEGSNVGESFINDSTVLSKLKINLPIPQDQFDTCLDIALRCLTQGKTIEELYSCDPLLCSATTHFTTASLEKLFGPDSLFKQLHICHSHGNESVKYRELPDVYSDTKSNTSETVEVLLKPSLIYSVDGVGLKVSAENIHENNFALDSSQYDTDFLKTVPRAILHLIGMENDKEFCETTVESEDVVKYCYLIKNYKHLKNFDNNREFYTKLKQLKRLQNESSKVTIESYISAQATTLHRSQTDYGIEPDESCLKTEICSFLSEQSYPILGGSLSELESISEIDLEDLISSTNIPSKLALFSNSITSSIQAWLKDWSSFKADFLAIFLNRCKVIEQFFIPDSKDFPDSLVCKLLLSYGSKTVKIDNEKLIKILYRDQSEHTMNDFIENIQPGSDEMDNLKEKSNYVNMENLSRSDIFPYCPVTYKEEGKLFIASDQFAATFKDEVYNFATKTDQEKFFDNPENYAVQPTSDYRVPPLRICVLSNLFFDDEKRLTRQVADYFNLQSVSLNREIKKLLMQNDSKQLGLINEDTTNMDMFDLGETMFDQDDTYVRKINYIRDCLNLKSTLTDSDLKILVDELFCSSTGKVIYGFPHIVEDLSFIVNEKITPNVVVYIDVGDEKRRKIESLQRKVRDQRLLNYGSRLRKLMKLDRLKYVLWNRSRSKLFNIVLRQLLKERRDDKLPTKRLNQLFSRKETTENLDTSGENDDGNDVATRSKNNDLIEENNSTAEKVDSEEGILLKKSPKAGNILYSRKIDAKNRDEFRAYLLEKRKECADEIEIFSCESQTGVLKSNKSFQCFKHLRSSRLAEKNQLNQVASFESQDANDSKDGESLEERELDDRKQVALMDLRHASKEQDRFLPKFESVHYLPADYDAKKEYYLESSSKASSERMGMDPTDSICSREITSSINLHPNLPTSKKSRKIALQYGVHKISEEFLINAYNIFRTKYPPPKSSARNLKPINFNENMESLNTYCSYETENINAMKDLCSKFNIPIIKHSTTNSINKLLESIKSITRWPDVFEKCHIITHKTASELLNNGHYFFSKFGRWCPVAIFEKRLPILQNYPEERLEKLVHPVIHKKYIYFIHTRTSLEKFVSSPLKYIEQDPYLTVFPVKIAVVGCPKSGKTKIIDYLRNLYGLQVIRIDTAVQYVCSQLHWTELAQKIHACLKQGNLLSSQLTVQALEAYLLSPKYVNHGWILDGFPNSKDDVQAMKKCDIIPQVTICVETNAFWENSVTNKLHEDRIHLENLNDGLSCGRLKNDVLGKHQEDDNETLFNKYLLPKNFFKYRILKWRQNKAMHEELKTAMNDGWGNILEISWKTNHLKMVARMLEYVKTCLLAFQNYATNMQQNLPASMFCLNLSRTEFEMHLSVFKEVCPCCWYFSKIYHRCPTKNFRDMTTGLYQYGNYIYWICTEHTDIFLHNPTIFINHDVSIFKATYPERLSLVGEKTIEQYFDLQFHGKCVTCYVKNLPNIVLKKGLKTYALALEKKYIYLFCQESCLLSMLIKPQDFSTIKYTRKLKTPNLSPKVSSSTVSTTKNTTKLSPKLSSSTVSKTKHSHNLSPKVSSSTVSTTKPIIVPDYFDNCNIYDVLCNALLRVAKVRPRIFEIDNETSSCIYLALILKAQANKSIIVILNDILACFESYSNMIHVTCSFIDRLACALNVSNLDENDGTEVHIQYFFDRLIPLLASRSDDKYIRDE
ncbi:hypothetical protein LSTR_LSTR004519 [Laodelphax striatellus]|uniref:Uncharacterized protein n=1 Tax=Laodelphax striatellus TaxID=195883 RepID=A0A482XGX7_LAOST|nr:hypothetical protein LSTR_LSTR004519 [Laodelphax striatellus]